MKEDKALHIAVGMGVVGGFVGGAVLAFLIYVFGITDVDPKIVRVPHTEAIVAEDHFWREWIGALSGWAAAAAAGLTIAVLLRHFNELKYQRKLLSVDVKISAIRRLDYKVAMLKRRKRQLTAIRGLLARVNSIITRESITDRSIRFFCITYEIALSYENRDKPGFRLAIGYERDSEDTEAVKDISRYLSGYFRRIGPNAQATMDEFKSDDGYDIERLRKYFRGLVERRISKWCELEASGIKPNEKYNQVISNIEDFRAILDQRIESHIDQIAIWEKEIDATLDR